MELRYKGREDLTSSVSLLISILIRYPEVAKINYDPESHNLKFTFIYAGVLAENESHDLSRNIISSIEVYNSLESKVPRQVKINFSESDNLTMIEIQRDVDTLVQEEIALIVDLLRQNISKCLVTEDNDSLIDEDLVIQEELIEHMLESIKAQSENKRLYAFRDEGRVLVFNK